MTRLLVSLFALGCTSGLPAAEAWEKVASLPGGTKVRVKTFDHVTHRGAVRSVDSDFIRLNEDGQETVASRQDIARVEVYKPSRRLRNALIGGSIGAAAGIVAGFATCPSCVGELGGWEFQKRLVYGGIAGGGAGAGLGLLGAPYKTVYKGRRRRR